MSLLVSAVVLALACGPRDPQLKKETAMVTSGLEVLRSGTPLQRDSTIRTLYSLKHAELLTAHLDDPDPNVRIAMVSALGFLKDKSSAPALNRLLTTATDYLLRETVLYAVGEVCDTSSVPILVALLTDPATDRDLRLSIPITLASFGHGEATPQVVKAFTDILEANGGDIELCSYVSVGVMEVLSADNVDSFRRFLPELKRMAEQRKAEAGTDDGIYTNFDLTIQELEHFGTPAGS
ncbi:HEAT repeat domain-containing protein [bacterium]|nr:HEAT repeat domain-containing protein [bacterium]